MTTPRVTETEDPRVLAHLIQRGAVVASILAVPDKDHGHRPALEYPRA